MKYFLLTLGFILSINQSFSQECADPDDASWFSSALYFITEFYWSEPESECDILYYELQWYHDSFDPSENTGNLISPVQGDPFNGGLVHWFDGVVPEESEAYIRTVCDCDGDNEPDAIGSGEGGTNGWVLMPFTFEECICGETIYEYSIEILNADFIYESIEEVDDLSYVITSEIPEEEISWYFFHSQSETTDEFCNTIVNNEIYYTFESCNQEFCTIELVGAIVASWTYTILNQDELSPDINCTENELTVSTLDNSIEVPDLTEYIQVSDNCSFTLTQSPPVGEILSIGEHIITFTATDPSQNTSSCEMTLVIEELSTECPEPINPAWDTFENVTTMYWTEPEPICDSIYYEIRYDFQPFNPDNSEGFLISPIEDIPGGNFFNFYEDFNLALTESSEVYIRTVCVCPGEGGTGEGDLIVSTSGWTGMTGNGVVECFCLLYEYGGSLSISPNNPNETFYCPEDIPNQAYEANYSPEYDENFFELPNPFFYTDNVIETQIDDNTTLLEYTVTVYEEFCNTSICDYDANVVEEFSWTHTVVNEPAEIACQDVTLEFVSTSNGFEIIDLSEYANIESNCSYDISQQPAAGELLSVGEHLIELVITNVQGDVSTCEISINVIPEEIDFESNLSSYQMIECGEEIPQLEYTLGQNLLDSIENSTYFLEETETSELTECGERIIYGISITTADQQLVLENEFEIEITDETPPVWDPETPLELEFQCDALNIPLPTATDNCSNTIEYTVDENSVDSGCTLTIIRETTATDECGNASTFVQIIEVTDEVLPQFSTVAEDISLECGMPLPPPVNMQAEDNCGTTFIEFIEEEIILNCGYAIERIWVATDECGNSSSEVQTITFLDTEEPEISECPNEILLSLNENGLYDLGDYTLQFESEDDCSEIMEVQFPVNLSDVDILEYESITFTSTDACGNIASCEVPVIYEIEDSISEEFSAEMSVFPNPSNGLINIDLNLLFTVKIVVINTMGQKIEEYKIEPGSTQINMQNLSSGVYSGQVYDLSSTYLGKVEFIVE